METQTLTKGLRFVVNETSKSKDQQFKEKAEKYALDEIKSERGFVKIRKQGRKNLYTLPGNALKIMLYLIGEINRDTGKRLINGQEVRVSAWMDLQKFYAQGYLVTARTQDYIAKQIDIDPAQVSRGIAQLKELDYIRVMGKIVKPGTFISYTVFCLGEVRESHNKKPEIYYYELDTVEEDEEEF